jgi:hypothetical protein
MKKHISIPNIFVTAIIALCCAGCDAAKHAREDRILDVGSGRVIWKSKDADSHTAAAFLFADKAGCGLAIIGTDGRIVHQQQFGGIVGWQKNVSPPAFHATSYKDDKSVSISQPTPDKKWLVWENLTVGSKASGWIYLEYIGEEMFAICNGKDIGSSTTLPKLWLSKNGQGCLSAWVNVGSITVKFNDSNVGTFTTIVDPTISDDGHHYAFVSVENNKSILYVDGKREKEYPDVAGLRFSPDGKRLAYVVKQGSKSRVVLDRKDGAEYDGVANVSLTFSGDGKHLVYIVQKEGKYLMVRDGKEIGGYDEFGQPKLSEDGKHLAFIGAKGGMTRMVIDNQEGQALGQFTDLTFSADGSHSAYFAVEDKTWRVIKDGQQGGEYSGIVNRSIIFSPDGSHYAYCAIKGERSLVVRDGKEEREFDDICGPVARADGAFEYLATEKNKVHHVICPWID